MSSDGTQPRPNGVWLQTVRHARRLIVFVVGSTLAILGVVMLVTPGPGWLLIIAGLSVLAIEFVWARRLLRSIKAKGNDLRRILLGSRPESDRNEPGACPEDTRPGGVDRSGSAPD